MAPASQPAVVAELRARLERMTAHGGSTAAALPFGIEAIDEHLPGGGLCLGHLHEVIEAGPASEHAAIASIFAAGILARLPGPVLWCLRGRDLFAPALARVGLHPDRVIYCETWKDRDVLPAMEEGLRCKGLAGVVGEATHLSLNISRRLQLCAGESGVTALLIRRWRHAGEKEQATEPNAAATRWRIAPTAVMYPRRTRLSLIEACNRRIGRCRRSSCPRRATTSIWRIAVSSSPWSLPKS
jgi:protein ImuA